MSTRLKLYPYQKIGVAFLTSKKKSLLADDMGIGKTAQAICACNELKAKQVLVVCPASLKLNWQDELGMWLKEDLKVYIVQKRSAIIPKNANIIIVNYDIISHSNIYYQLRNRKYDVVIMDECHYLKNMKASRTKTMLGSKGLIHSGKYSFAG